jgi:hypothetical protein
MTLNEGECKREQSDMSKDIYRKRYRGGGKVEFEENAETAWQAAFSHGAIVQLHFTSLKRQFSRKTATFKGACGQPYRQSWFLDLGTG